jgi:ABC-type multidrug transport system ATPase subunit
MSGAEPAIEIEGLTKDYGAGHGLFDLRLAIDAGDVFGFLGPNGAGKTTTIRLLMGMIRPTAGWAKIFGLDCRKQSAAVKRKVGYLPGELAQFGGLRGSEVVSYIGGLRGGFDHQLARQIAESFDLDLGRRFREYSRGNKQKLGILLAFMHRPQLLILDEPTGGLDPLNQQQFYKLVLQAKAEGATVFLSSHILSEVEHVCDRVGIIRHGRLVKVAEMEELHDIRLHHVEIQFAGEPPVAELFAVPGIEKEPERDGDTVTLTLRGSFEPMMAALAGSRVLNLISHEPSLEEIFLAYYKDEEKVPPPALATTAG